MAAEATATAAFLPGPENIQIGIRGLTKVFDTRAGSVPALDSVDLTIDKGEFLVVVGPSGCGKTTLLRILAGLERQTTGTVSLPAPTPGKPLRGMVFQEQSIFPWMSVRNNVGYGLDVRGVPRAERDPVVDAWLRKVGLARFHRHYPHQLSGGMKQRVSLARAFATDPDILLMDEPFSALDEQNRIILQQELLRIWEETRKTVVFITHSMDEALILGDRIMVMTSGPGKVKEIVRVPFSRPRNVMELRANPRYGELLYRLWGLLQDEVRKSRAEERSR